MDPNLDKTIHVGSADFASNLGGPANLYIPIHPLPLPLFMSEKIVFVGKMLPLPPPPPKTWDPRRPWGVSGRIALPNSMIPCSLQRQR